MILKKPPQLAWMTHASLNIQGFLTADRSQSARKRCKKSFALVCHDDLQEQNTLESSTRWHKWGKHTLLCKLDARALSSLFVSSACHAIKAPVFPLDQPWLNISCERISCVSHCLIPRCRTPSRSSSTMSVWIFVCRNATALASFSPIWNARATCVALSHAWGWNLFSRNVEI